ncbi:MAG: hypothetical protein M3220_02775 [Chloroflexota bacterium]|nr:hypothetical protein [Chloroflexota bacterium]
MINAFAISEQQAKLYREQRLQEAQRYHELKQLKATQDDGASSFEQMVHQGEIRDAPTLSAYALLRMKGL